MKTKRLKSVFLIICMFMVSILSVSMVWGEEVQPASTEQPTLRVEPVIAKPLDAPIVASVTAEKPSESWQPVVGFKPWSGVIRPGVVFGPGIYKDVQTDFEFDMFFPVWGNKERLLFFNPRMRFSTEGGSSEFNFGLGYRRLVADDRFILGVNSYYDTMLSPYRKHYNQVGFGLEALSKWLDFRSNLYIPFGSTKHKIKHWENDSFDYYLMEEATKGVDAELGFMVPYISDAIETHAYIGGYWYDSELVDNLNGWKARVEMRPGKIIVLGYEYRKDNTRNGDTFLSASLEIPFSLEDLSHGRNPFGGLNDALKGKGGPRELRDRMTEKVVRDRHITIVSEVVEVAKKHSCGNGKIEANEQCDDGNANNNDGCSSICQTERCGDGIQQTNEQCDDGNTTNSDGCSSTCLTETPLCTGTETQACSTGQQGVCSAGTQTCSGGQWGSCVQNTQSSSEAGQCYDGLDNDCDGLSDVLDSDCAACTGTETQACSTGQQGVCSAGTQTCSGGQWGSCVQNTQSSTEVCDGIDNNCDGQIDENLTRGTTCGVGACASTGTETCSAGNWDSDTCTAGTPTTETCGDGIDQDCNGSDLACPLTCGGCLTTPSGKQGWTCVAGDRPQTTGCPAIEGGPHDRCATQAEIDADLCSATVLPKFR